MKNDGLKVTFSLSPPFIPLLVVFLIHLLEKAADNKLYAIWAINFMSHRAHQSSESGGGLVPHNIDCCSCVFKGLLCVPAACCLGCVNEWRNRYVSTNKAREILQQALYPFYQRAGDKRGICDNYMGNFSAAFHFPTNTGTHSSLFLLCCQLTHKHCCCKKIQKCPIAIAKCTTILMYSPQVYTRVGTVKL